MNPDYTNWTLEGIVDYFRWTAAVEDEDGTAGVREPRGPKPVAPSGSAARTFTIGIGESTTAPPEGFWIGE